jgi:hypothetical protein
LLVNIFWYGNYLTDFGKKGHYFSLGMQLKFGSKIRGAKTLINNKNGGEN